MNWTDQIDIYCERVDASLWSEPVNAITNLAFLIAAFVMWRRVRGKGMPAAMGLVVILTMIGVGSFLFHTYATQWASTADVVPILLFILIYLFIVQREFMAWPVWAAAIGTVGFFPYAVGVTMVANTVPFFAISNFYWSVPVLLFAFAAPVSKRAPDTARGMVLGGGLLCVSIAVRSLDNMVCDAFPLGTHFLWHCLNGLMLGWMIEVYRRHRLAGAGAGG